ncbi:MAG: hypothetical protein KC635_11335, partial [Myxococcales bacterium]|nr:hypothetical protein [Myxococcales bacterium]
VILPMGGVTAIANHLAPLLARTSRPVIAGLCDAAEAPVFERALTAAGLGPVGSRAEMAARGFFVCDADLESELIRALGVGGVFALLAAHDDDRAFATFGKQAVWRERPIEAQLHRFLRSSAARNLRYARLLVEALPDDRVPAPLDAALAAVGIG